MIKVKKTKTMGRGIFACKSFKKGQLIDTNHMMIYPISDAGKYVEGSKLWSYHFEVDRLYCGIALGSISLVNHDEDPNATHEIYKRKQIIKLKAIKNIKKGEQIFIDYGYDPKDYL